MRSFARCQWPFWVVVVLGVANCSRRESKPNETDRIGVPVPKAAVSALGAYARTGHTPGNRELPTVTPLDGGVRKPSKPQVSDGGVPL
ncbi:MAG TPA: hypothetical protein VL137_17370 [Polyangiaceae bacterium]|nr:hypothetical protein [Polyangiaceae bacterium]